jgi:hypothetical protein
MNYSSDQPIVPLPNQSVQVERKRAIAYSMDTLIPGFYCWTPFGNWQIGGSVAEYRIFTTYRDSYDPRSSQH